MWIQSLEMLPNVEFNLLKVKIFPKPLDPEDTNGA